MIRMSLQLDSDDLFSVAEMRYFVGPTDVGTGPDPEEERWYVEASLRDDPSVAGRWIGSGRPGRGARPLPGERDTSFSESWHL